MLKTIANKLGSAGRFAGKHVFVAGQSIRENGFEVTSGALASLRTLVNDLSEDAKLYREARGTAKPQAKDLIMEQIQLRDLKIGELREHIAGLEDEIGSLNTMINDLQTDLNHKS